MANNWQLYVRRLREMRRGQRRSKDGSFDNFSLKLKNGYQAYNTKTGKKVN
jgi:hypothetical protein